MYLREVIHPVYTPRRVYRGVYPLWDHHMGVHQHDRGTIVWCCVPIYLWSHLDPHARAWLYYTLPPTNWLANNNMAASETIPQG